MITEIAEKLTTKLLSNGYLAAAEKEEIAYGIFTFFSRCFFLLICIFFGFLFHCFVESVAYYFTFLFVKKYAGGYHASTETKCILLSSISIFTSIILIFVFKNITFYPSVIAGAIIASTIIYCFAPVENKEKPLTEDEKKEYKLNTLIRLCVLLMIIVALYCFSLINFCIAIVTGLELECVLMLAGKIKQYAGAHK